MSQLTLVQAVQDALRCALDADNRVILLGEDVGRNGGVFRATEGLQERFGADRVVDTPLSESGILGASVGLAANGMRPVPEIQFLGFIYPGFQQVVAHIARMRWRSQGHYGLPMVVRAPFGGRIRAPELHSESTEAYFIHTPGLTVVAPSNPYDAKGLLLASIEFPDPVIFLEPMRIYRAFRTEVPEAYYTVPLGKAELVKVGEDVTVVTWGTLVRETLEVVHQLERDKGWSIELLDLRTLSPWDEEAVFNSVHKTGRVVVVQEATLQLGLAAEIAARVGEECLLDLEAPVTRVASWDVPPPLFQLEDWHAPTAQRIVNGIERVMIY
ncbi:alpha-ketoacid dehydrogenase subunit beta [Alicyclobacillaceae bacterium I2511]|nr:alpha-ketoacid dehydrogenase subunit beta [Alicyclobacillaceae bacterium I2511]